MFKIMILQSLYIVSDEQIEFQVRDCLSFKRFLGLSLDDTVPDANIELVPKQRNSRDENKFIKNGEIPNDWSRNQKSHKDTDVRWIKKNRNNQFGYKNHIDVDVKYKLIRSYEVIPVSVHDSNVFEELLDVNKSNKDGR